MVDNLTKEHRSWNMSRIRSSDTGPERIVRSALHNLGYRFRLHRRDLPGKPDIVLPRYRTVVFVHGCFWHRHSKCKFAYEPKSRLRFWNDKFSGTIKRDREAVEKLKLLGWRVLIVWECRTKNPSALVRALRKGIGFSRSGS
jgi:DNA mismatch endonuclease (patch repair protein)